MPQPPERRASKSTAVAGMVSLPASDRTHLHQPQKPAVSNLHRQEQAPAAIKDDQSGHRSNCRLTTKTALRSSKRELSNPSRHRTAAHRARQHAC